MTDLTALKVEARKAAFLRRKDAKNAANDARATAHLLEAIMPFKGKVLAGYLPIRTEVDPVPVMAAMASFGPVCVPVIDGHGLPLKFREWEPGCEVAEGPFGVKEPISGAWRTPAVIIVPLVAFDRRGSRLGYGGGFYDRTLDQLRGKGAVTAIGFAFAEQEAPDLPVESTDAVLDAVVTETGVVRF